MQAPSEKKMARNIAVDVYRGTVMLLMMAEVLRLATVAKGYPDNPIWQFLGYNQTHVEWAGLSLHDMIQPSFTLLAGVALPYSIHSRQRRGQTFRSMLLHTIWRSFLLVMLGILLRGIQHVTFEDTLTQIGLGYTVVFLLAFCKPRWQWTSLAVVLFGYWLAWALYPVAGAGFDYASVGVPLDWHTHLFSGFAAHWNKNANLGAAFDHWFLNLFPRSKPFLYNRGGYLTLSFIPTLGTMILGLIAGRWFVTSAPSIPLRRLIVGGLLLLTGGLLLHFTGICPIVKRVWTPAWVLFSGGICYLVLAALGWLIDVRQHRRWGTALVIIGTNSIAAYLLAELCGSPLNHLIRLGGGMVMQQPHVWDSLVFGAVELTLFWMVLWTMHRKKIFVRI
ncbi:MAG: DUF5009 domain-containing protein [Acidobacteria bacterium]|nr:DUF5009 domain-containing protein [Acidobacteriota bacterium]